MFYYFVCSIQFAMSGSAHCPPFTLGDPLGSYTSNLSSLVLQQTPLFLSHLTNS